MAQIHPYFISFLLMLCHDFQKVPYLNKFHLILARTFYVFLKEFMNLRFRLKTKSKDKFIMII